MRVVVDTNVVISGVFFGGRPCASALWQQPPSSSRGALAEAQKPNFDVVDPRNAESCRHADMAVNRLFLQGTS